MQYAARLIAMALAAAAPIAVLVPPADAQQRQEARTDRVAPFDAMMQNFDRMAFGEEGERRTWTDRKSTRLNSSHSQQFRMPSSA